MKWLPAAATLVIVSLSVWFAVLRPSEPPPGVVRVGVDQSPPFYVIQPDGSVRGLAVDVLNEAARLRGIKLVWKPVHGILLEDALRKRIVDIWPLVGSTPERQVEFYLGKPWFENEYILASLRSHPVPSPTEAAGQIVAQPASRFTAMLAKRYLPRSQFIVLPSCAEVIQAVCSGKAAAALVEGFVLDAILLTRPHGCEDADFQISTLDGGTLPWGMIAVPEARRAAAMLRDEISVLQANGFLNRALDEWAPFSARGNRSIWAEEAANTRSFIYGTLLIVILLFSAVLAWVAWRAWRLKALAEQAEAGRREEQRRFAAFMENSPALSFMKDAGGRLLYASGSWTQLLGRTPEECQGKNDFELWPHETARMIRAIDVEVLRENKPRQVIETVPVSSAATRDLLVIKFPFRNRKGEQFVGGTGIDITERQAAIRELAASEARYRELFEHNPLPAWVCDRSTLAFLHVNEAAIKRYGWTREDFISGMTLHEVISADAHRSVLADPSALDSAHAKPGAWRHRTKDGLLLSVDVTSYELEYEHRPARLMIIRDLTERERTLEQLRVSEERWKLALRGAGDGLWDWDLTTDCVFRSPRWRAMLGYSAADVGETREDFLRLLHPEDVEPTLRALEDHLSGRTSAFSAEYRLRHRDGTWRWIMDRGQAVRDERGRAIRMAGSHTDITDRKTAEHMLAFQARTDALTGICNRREFDRLLAKLTRDAREKRRPLSVCVCDLDHFKRVNDRFGHATGDRVLVAFADILRRNLRRTDVLARLGGDEFVLALPETTAAESYGLVERMRQELLLMKFDSEPGATFEVSSCFGIAELREEHRDGRDLVNEADRLLYEAKRGGRNRTLTPA